MPIRFLLTVVPLFLIAILSGCTEDRECCYQPCPPDELIRGQVLGGLGPLERISVEADHRGPNGEMAMYLCRTAEDGTYELPVAPGEHYVWIRSPGGQRVYYDSDGLTCRREDVTTITVGDGTEVVTADFLLGAFQIDLQLPPALAAERLYFYLAQYDEPGESFYVTSDETEEARQVVLDVLPPGSYHSTMRLSHPSAYTGIGRYTIDLSALCDSVVITAREVSPCSLTLPEPGYLTGIITGDWAQLDAGLPTVCLYGAEGKEFVDMETDSSGGFSIPVFTTATARVRVELGGIAQWVGGDDFETADVYAIDPTSTITMDPVPVGGLICHFAGDPTWPLEAELCMFDASGSVRLSRFIHSEETISVPNLAPGSYSLFLAWDDPTVWRPQWYDRAASPAQATPVLLEETGAVTEVTFVLEEGGRITGRVLAADGTPAVDISLRVQAIGYDLDWSPMWETDGEGLFQIEGLPDDEIKLAAWVHDDQGARYVWYPGVLDEDLAHTIVITDAGTVTDVEWQLLP